MYSYISEWNKETVMAQATRLLHITQELAVDAVPKYTKKHYAQLGFGATSLAHVTDELELALVQEAYTIAWEYLNLSLQYVPIAVTNLTLDTHNGLLDNFIGTASQREGVFIGDTQGVYTCASSNTILARWLRPILERTAYHYNSITGRVLVGTRTCRINTGFETDLKVMSDVERMSAEEPMCIRLSKDNWWLVWYPKQQYMMLNLLESDRFCYYPSEVVWSYRVAPSSYQQCVFYSKDWGAKPDEKPYTFNFLTQYPAERKQTEYAYEVRNTSGGFDWVEVHGSLPVYKCPPMFVQYFNRSCDGVQFVGDSSLEVNNLYSEVLASIDDPRSVSGYILLESAVSSTDAHISLSKNMYYVQLELFAVPLSDLFPIRQNSMYTRVYKFPKPRQHSSGQYIPSASNTPTWVYVAPDKPEIRRAFNTPPLSLDVGGVEYKLNNIVNPARNLSGLVLFPNFDPFMFTKAVNAFDDTAGFSTRQIGMLGVRYTPDGDAYAICIAESSCYRDWTVSTVADSPQYPLEVQPLHKEFKGIDLQPILDRIEYKPLRVGGPGRFPQLNLPKYHFYIQLAQNPTASGLDYQDGRERFYPQLLKHDDDFVGQPKHSFWVFHRESEQYQFLLNTPTGGYGSYTAPVLPKTITFPTTLEVFYGS